MNVELETISNFTSLQVNSGLLIPFLFLLLICIILLIIASQFRYQRKDLEDLIKQNEIKAIKCEILRRK